MIKDGFYEQSEEQYGIKYTRSIEDMYGTDYQPARCPTDIAKPYYMGYVEPEMYPDSLNVFAYDVKPPEEGEERPPAGKIHLTPVKRQNYSWMYTVQKQINNNVIDLAPNLYQRVPDTNGYKWQQSLIGYSGQTPTRFINEMEIAKYTWNGYFRLWAQFHTLNNEDYAVQYNSNQETIKRADAGTAETDNYITFDDLDKFMKGKLKFKITRSYSGTTYTTEFGINDWDEDEGCFKLDASSYGEGYYFVIMPTNITGYPRVIYNGVYENIKPCLVPMFKVECYDDDGNDTSILINRWNGSDTGRLNFALNFYTNALHFTDNKHLLRNHNYFSPFAGCLISYNSNTLNLDEVVDFYVSKSWNNTMHYYNNGRIYDYGGYSNSGDSNTEYCRYISCVCAVSIHDIYFLLSFMNRVNSEKRNYDAAWTSTPNYNNLETTPTYDDNDSPTLIRVQGDYDKIEPDLRPWQKQDADITENDYDESKKPEPPPPPEDPDDPANDHFPDDGRKGSVPLGHGDMMFCQSMSNYIAFGIDGFLKLQQALSVANPEFWQKLGTFSVEGGSAVETITSSPSGDIGKYILSCRQYPFDVAHNQLGYLTPAITRELAFGYRGAKLNLGVDMYTLNTPICSLNFGSVFVGTLQGGNPCFWDYEPYTDISIYLPAIGFIPLSATQVIGTTLSIQALVDLTSGMISYIVVSDDGKGSEIVVAQKTGKISIDVGISGNNLDMQSQNIVNASLNNVNRAVQSVVGVGTALATGNVPALATSLVGASTGLAQGVIDSTLSSRDVPQNITSTSGVSAGIGCRTPYLSIKRPVITLQDNAGFSHANGYLYNETKRLSTIGSGYCKVVNPDLSGLDCTSEEKEMLTAILQTGFYI